MKFTKKTGIKKCSDKTELEKVKSLVKVQDNDYFIIDNLTHSHPLITERGKVLLNDIGERFNSKLVDTDLSGARFIVTSLTRTKDNVKSLRKINGNASKNSAHMYGECFDITYARFSSDNPLRQCDIAYLKETLATVILNLRKENRCWALTEHAQPCYHVVCR